MIDTGASEDWRATNHAMWDERVPIHTRSDFYDLAAIRSGQDALRGFEIDEVGDVAGQRLLHLQCHIGTDTLSWARRGAEVTGLDFSGAAVEAARGLAADLGQENARFVESDVYDATSALGGEAYDIVYTGLGALCWLPDLDAWAATVAALLMPGGFLYLAEFHPVGLSQGVDYFTPGPFCYQVQGSYADPGAPTRHNRAVEWQHPLGEVVSAVAGAGLRLEFLHEHDFTLWAYTDGMTAGPDTSGANGGGGTVFRLPAGRPQVPLIYSLRAARD